DAETVDDAVVGVLQTIVDTIGWEIATFWSTEPERPRVIRTKPDVVLDGFIATTERSLLTQELRPGRVARDGAPEWLEELDADRYARAPVAIAEGLRSGVAFPVTIEHEVVGVIETFSAVPRPHDLDLERTFVAIGAQLGQFVRRKRAEEERHQLFEREQEAREHAEAAVTTLRKLARVSEVALQHLSLSDLLNALLDRLVEVLDADEAAILMVGDDGALHYRATVGLGALISTAIPIPLGEGMA